MTKNRLDGWTLEEEKLLVDIILATLKNGGTQMSAFLEAGQKLKRTPTACGHRWNRVLRKRYASKIEDAKTAWRMDQTKFEPSLDPQGEQVPRKALAIVEQQESTSNLLASTANSELLFRLSDEITSLRDEIKTLSEQLIKAQEKTDLFFEIFDLVYKKVMIINNPLEK